MKLKISAVASLLSVVVLASCGSDSSKKTARALKDLTDEQKVAYMMEQAEPDSVARFVVLASVGLVPDVTIDTLLNANSYALEHYDGIALDKYCEEIERFPHTLSMRNQMRYHTLSGEDKETIALRLGLEYPGKIRSLNMSAEDIDKELSEFRENESKDNYDNLLKGFKAALQIDKGRGVPESVYAKYGR